MSTIYGVEDNETNRTTLLRERLRNARSDSGGVAYTPLVALGLMAFYVFALMCTSTVAVTIRECGGGWAGVRWAALQFAYMLGLAYGVALLVYQIGFRL
jgi:ferrous iron transport protein B